jgi:hypothetical protein
MDGQGLNRNYKANLLTKATLATIKTAALTAGPVGF